MWEISNNYGDCPAPRRYFLREPVEVASEVEDEEEEEDELDWRSFSVILMRALLPFAEAKAAVLAAFGAVGAVPASP